METINQLLQGIAALPERWPLLAAWYTAIVRFLFPVLAFLILYQAISSLLTIPHTPEVWGQLSLPNGSAIPLKHWENIIGRSKTADVQLNYPSISRQHAAICRGEREEWTLYDLGSKGGTFINGEAVEHSAPVQLGDTITLGGVELMFLPQTVDAQEKMEQKRRLERPAAIFPAFFFLTLRREPLAELPVLPCDFAADGKMRGL